MCMPEELHVLAKTLGPLGVEFIQEVELTWASNRGLGFMTSGEGFDI